MRQFIASVVSIVLLTSVFLLLLIAYQVDIAVLFGLSQKSPSAISLLRDFASPLAASFGGAVAGSLITFNLQNKKEERKTREEELTALNKTVVALESQLNDLVSIKKSSIIPVRDEPMRFLEIQRLSVVEHVAERIDLNFAPPLIRLKKAAQIQKIRIAENRYVNVINVLKRRDSIKEQIDRMTFKAGINMFNPYFLSDIYKIIGPNNLALIYKMTEDYICLLDNALTSLWEAIKEIESVSMEYYKDLDIGKLSFDLLEVGEEIIGPTPKPVIENEKKLLMLAGHKAAMEK